VPSYYDRTLARWRYEFDRWIDGRRLRATKLLPKEWGRAEARAYARERDAALFAVATGAVKPARLISEAVLLYLRQRAPLLKSRHIIERELALCVDAYTGRRINELAAVAREYAAANATRLQPGTIRNRMAYLRSACRWAWRHHGIGEHDPAERLVLPPVHNEAQVYLSRAEVLRACRRISPAGKGRDARAGALVAFYTGMRQDEILRAEVTPDRAKFILLDTKNGKPRLVPVHPAIAHIARRWPLQVSARTLHKRWTRAAAEEGIECTFHTLRHSTASALLGAGVDMRTIGGVLGHRSIQSTARYAHLQLASLEAAVLKLRRRSGG
jgi:integrase